MRIAILSDIHGNLDAFKNVLKDMKGLSADRAVCLGDSIGYGPEPEGTIKLIMKSGISCVKGNHEMALTEPKLQKWFNPAALESINKSIKMLSPESISYLSQLQSSLVINQFRFVHGCPPDSYLIYLFQLSETKMKKIFQESGEWISFVGHTHDLKLITFINHNVIHKPLHQGIVHLNPEAKYIINVGSVGQPRDVNNAAKYVIFDTSASTLDVRFVPYDVSLVYKKIIAAGLPRVHAERLL